MKTALIASLLTAVALSMASQANAAWPPSHRQQKMAQLVWPQFRPDKHIQRANRYLVKCLAPTAPVGEDIHNYDVAEGEFVVWWGQGEYQLGTVQVWWAHHPKKDHIPTLAGAMFSTYGITIDSDLYKKVDACTSGAVNNDIWRG